MTPEVQEGGTSRNAPENDREVQQAPFDNFSHPAPTRRLDALYGALRGSQPYSRTAPVEPKLNERAWKGLARY